MEVAAMDSLKVVKRRVLAKLRADGEARREAIVTLFAGPDGDSGVPKFV